MIDWSLYLAFLVAVTVLVLTPGPDMVFIIAVGARGGPWHGFAAALGVAAGLSVHTAAAVFGLSALFTALPPLYHALRWVGAAYLLYLAYTAWRDRNEPVVPVTGVSLDRAAAFRKAFVVNVLNPKVILFNVAFLPQFVDPGLGNVGFQFLVLGATFVLVDLTIDGPIGLAAGHLGRLLQRSKRLARALNVFTASVFAGLAARLLWVQE